MVGKDFMVATFSMAGEDFMMGPFAIAGENFMVGTFAMAGEDFSVGTFAMGHILTEYNLSALFHSVENLWNTQKDKITKWRHKLLLVLQACNRNRTATSSRPMWATE